MRVLNDNLARPRRDRLGTEARYRPVHLLLSAAVEHRDDRAVARQATGRRIALDDDVRLHLIAGGLGIGDELDEALALGGSKGGDVDERTDVLGTARRRLR